MKSVPPRAARDVLLLSLVAGSADAFAYVTLGKVFVSNMTGNVVLLGIDLGQGHFADASRSVLALAAFMLGVGVGARVGRRVPDKDWPQLVRRLIRPETIVLLLIAVAWMFPAVKAGSASYALLTSLAVAMGLQSAALNRLGAPGVGTTAITSTITALTTGLAAPSPDSRGERVRFQLGVLILYGLGAAGSGFLLQHQPGIAGWVPVVFALQVAWQSSKSISNPVDRT